MTTLLQVELLARLAATYPEGVAWRDLAQSTELSLAEWHAGSNRVARGLRQQGLVPGDLVALAITPREPLTWLVSYMGVHKMGAVAVPLNTRLGGPELVRILRHARPQALVASADFLARHPQVRPEVPLTIATDDADGSLPWAELLHTDSSDLSHRIDPCDIADVMYTSGTTGEPKGVVVRHGGLSTIDREPSQWLDLGFLSSSPFSTTSGSLLICGPMRGGLSGWFLPTFDPARWVEVVANEHPVVAFLVPAMVELLVARAEPADLSSLAVVNIGSAPIAAETLRRFSAMLPSAEVLCGYGMTEFGAVTAMPMGEGGRHAGSVGTPLPGVELRVVGPDGSELSAGSVGEIVIRGERPPRTYFRDETTSGSTWQGAWLQSGDLGSVDSNGFVWIAGRKKEMIIRGGHNVMPGEVESVLFTYPFVAEAAVAGIPHDVLGEDVAAWVVARPGTAIETDTLHAFLADHLADYKVPRRITVVDALPRNEAGKVLKAQLVSGLEPRSAS